MGRNYLRGLDMEEYNVLSNDDRSSINDRDLGNVEIMYILDTYREGNKVIEYVRLEGGKVVKRTRNEDGSFVYHFSD